MVIALATGIEAGVHGILNKYITTVSASIAAQAVPWVIAGTTAYIMLMGWAIWRGEVHNPVDTVIFKIVKMSCINAVALTYGVYQTYVVGGLMGIEDYFTTALGGVHSVGALIDASIVPMDSISQQLMVQANATMIPNFTLLMAAVLCTLGELGLIAVSLIPLCKATVTTAFLLGIGPVYLALAQWPATLRYAEAWLAAALSNVMTVVVISAVVGFLPKFINAYANVALNQISTTNIFQDVVGLVAVIIVLGFIAWEAPHLGAQLAGGVGIGNPASAIAQTVMTMIAFRQAGAPAAPSNRITNRSPLPALPPPRPIAHQNVLSNLNTTP